MFADIVSIFLVIVEYVNCKCPIFVSLSSGFIITPAKSFRKHFRYLFQYEINKQKLFVKYFI